MSLMTPEERQKLVPKGLYVKNKCDGCGKPIMTPLTYNGPNGSDYCSRACLARAAGEVETDSVRSKAKEKPMAKETTDKLSKKKSKPVPSSNKSATGGSKDKELLKKKKRVVEDDEEEAPKKRKRVADDEAPKAKKKVKRSADEEPAPKKKAKAEAPAKSGSNPYSKPSSIVYQVFEMAKAGTTLKAIRSMLKEAGVQEARVLRELRSGEYKGFRWKYTESEDGKITVKPIKAKE